MPSWSASMTRTGPPSPRSRGTSASCARCSRRIGTRRRRQSMDGEREWRNLRRPPQADVEPLCAGGHAARSPQLRGTVRRKRKHPDVAFKVVFRPSGAETLNPLYSDLRERGGADVALGYGLKIEEHCATSGGDAGVGSTAARDRAWRAGTVAPAPGVATSDTSHDPTPDLRGALMSPGWPTHHRAISRENLPAFSVTLRAGTARSPSGGRLS